MVQSGNDSALFLVGLFLWKFLWSFLVELFFGGFCGLFQLGFSLEVFVVFSSWAFLVEVFVVFSNWAFLWKFLWSCKGISLSCLFVMFLVFFLCYFETFCNKLSYSICKILIMYYNIWGNQLQLCVMRLEKVECKLLELI